MEDNRPTIHVVTNPGIKEHINTSNLIKLSGTIVNKHESPILYLVTLAVNERANGNKTITNFPTFTVYKNKDNTSMIDEFMLHDAISIEGHISSNVRSREQTDSYKMQQIVVDKICEVKTIYPNAIGNNPGRGYNLEWNSMLLSGIIRRIENVNDSVTTLYIDALNGNIHNTLSVTTFGDVAKDIHENDDVTIYGRIATSRKVLPNGKRIYKQSLVGYEIVPNKESMRDVG